MSKQRILAGAAAAVMAVPLGIEGYYRFVYDRPDAYMVTRASERWFDRHFHRNARGFRADVEYVNERPKGKRRVAFLGDAFTAGHGIDRIADRFTDRVQAGIGDDWEVHNLGVLGVDTQDESTLIQQMLKRKYEVDEIVLVYNLDDLLTGVPMIVEGSNRLHAFFGNPTFWMKHSDWAELRALKQFIASDSVVAHADDLVGAAYGSIDLVEVEQARVARLRDVLASKKIALRIVVVPQLRDLGPDNRFRRVHERIGRMWTAIGVPYLDLLPAFEAKRDQGLMLAADDDHPNAAAHAIAADAILEFLRKNPVTAAETQQPAPPK